MNRTSLASGAVVVLASLASSACTFADTQCVQHVVVGTPTGELSETIRMAKHGEPVNEPFEEIAIVRSYGSGTTGTEAALLDALRSRARALGANGLVDVRYHYLSGEPGGMQGEPPFITAVAVHFQDALERRPRSHGQ